MKAIRLVSAGEPLVLGEVERPVAGDNEVLVEVAGCGVCHTDIGFWRDGVATRQGTPITLGHEISGVVVETGSLHRSLLNKEVIVPAIIPCGDCDLCRSGRGNACRSQVMPGNDADGGFAEYVKVPGVGMCIVEERGDYALEELSVIADAVTTPYQGVVRSGLGKGDLAVVVGVGGVGGYAVQIASAFGAKVVALDVDSAKLAAISGHGADVTLDPGSMNPKELKNAVRQAAMELGCSSYGWKIYECSGSGAGQETAFSLVTHASTLVVIGFTLEKLNLRLSNLMAFDASAIGNWGCRTELYPEVLRLVVEGKITLKPFIETHPMSHGPEVIRKAADHELERRAVLVPDWN